ncbi:hypothetical protein C5F51_09380 [Nocardia nova]|uniref:Guanylate kinase-like domain-containing protein n=2 Tax=Nocardia nova TaxID=37330 RepID=A0A2S6AAZ0_9NOCA|nr:hypothetical protein C5F51_09380 [Nocardia nova]
MRALCRKEGYRIVKSVTTRPPRGEEDDRRSVSDDEFRQLDESGEFISTSTIFNHRYALHRAGLDAALNPGSPVYVVDFALENWQDIAAFDGAMMGILVMPPSEEELKRRLRSQARVKRIDDAVDQYRFCLESIENGLPPIVGDRIVINEDILTAISSVSSLVQPVAGPQARMERPEEDAVGFMDDRDIRRAMERGELFERGTWSHENVHQASYGLRLDSEVMLATVSAEAASGRRDYRVVQVREGEGIRLNPGDTALLYSAEHFRLPADTLALTIPRGLLVAQSLLAGASYADPGFSGRFCVPVTNGSARIVTLQPGLEIVRVLFFRLGRDVQRAWSAADATSLRAFVESAPSDAPISEDELRTMSTQQLLETAQRRSNSAPVAKQLTLRLRRLYVIAMGAAVLWPVMLQFVNSDFVRRWLVSRHFGGAGVAGFIGNIAAGIVTAVLIWGFSVVSQRVRRPRRIRAVSTGTADK